MKPEPVVVHEMRGGLERDHKSMMHNVPSTTPLHALLQSGYNNTLPTSHNVSVTSDPAVTYLTVAPHNDAGMTSSVSVGGGMMASLTNGNMQQQQQQQSIGVQDLSTSVLASHASYVIPPPNRAVPVMVEQAMAVDEVHEGIRTSDNNAHVKQEMTTLVPAGSS